jgi:alkanesulfonate monooxygenase SsuD/methylene tetrahydromethanopterin reductase-like flavin-dependent oxidoreductase (luciferase family)
VGDGWITGIITPEEFRYTFALIRGIAAERYQRTLEDHFTTVLNCFINVSDHAAAAHEEGVRFLEDYHRRPFDDETIRRWLIHGSPEQCAETMSRFIEAGVRAFQLVPASRKPLEQIQRIADLVKPRLVA